MLTTFTTHDNSCGSVLVPACDAEAACATARIIPDTRRFAQHGTPLVPAASATQRVQRSNGFNASSLSWRRNVDEVNFCSRERL